MVAHCWLHQSNNNRQFGGSRGRNSSTIQLGRKMYFVSKKSLLKKTVIPAKPRTQIARSEFQHDNNYASQASHCTSQ